MKNGWHPHKENDESIKDHYVDGVLHNDKGPARVETKPDGSCVWRWFKRGVLHRIKEPAVVNTSGYKAWYKQGKFIKEENPLKNLGEFDKEKFNKIAEAIFQSGLDTTITSSLLPPDSGIAKKLSEEFKKRRIKKIMEEERLEQKIFSRPFIDIDEMRRNTLIKKRDSITREYYQKTEEQEKQNETSREFDPNKDSY